MAEYNKNYIPELPSITEGIDVAEVEAGEETGVYEGVLPFISELSDAVNTTGLRKESVQEKDLPDIIEGFTTIPECVEADFEADKIELNEGDSVLFTDLSIGSPNEWEWDFGDGRVSSLQHPSHVYSSAGIYTVQLKARQVVGNAYSEDTEIKVAYIEVLGVEGKYYVFYGPGSLEVDGVNVGFYTGGVEFILSRSLLELDTLSSIGIMDTRKVGEKFLINVTLLELTLENLKTVWNINGTIDVGENRTLDFGGGVTNPVFHELWFTHIRRNDAIRYFNVYKVVSFRVSEYYHKKNEVAKVNVQFEVVEDKTKPVGKRLGRIIDPE